jgi:hypothetical protein
LIRESAGTKNHLRNPAETHSKPLPPTVNSAGNIKTIVVQPSNPLKKVMVHQSNLKLSLLDQSDTFGLQAAKVS